MAVRAMTAGGAKMGKATLGSIEKLAKRFQNFLMFGSFDGAPDAPVKEAVKEDSNPDTPSNADTEVQSPASEPAPPAQDVEDDIPF
jgi:hypothetical protein